MSKLIKKLIKHYFRRKKMKELFESKEQYINFRNSWKDYINSGKAKKNENK